MAKKIPARMEYDAMQSLSDNPAWHLISEFVLNQIERGQSDLETCLPDDTGRIGRLQGEIKAYRQVLSYPQSRINYLASLAEKEERKA